MGKSTSIEATVFAQVRVDRNCFDKFPAEKLIFKDFLMPFFNPFTSF